MLVIKLIIERLLGHKFAELFIALVSKTAIGCYTFKIYH